MATSDADTFLLQLEAIAIASRLRRPGEHAADLVERWAQNALVGSSAET